jgi:hypothetical protein
MAEAIASLDGVIALLEAIWVDIDPDQEAEWRTTLAFMDLDVAEQAIIILRDASKLKPSVRLFRATYAGLKARRPEGEPRHPKAEWFDEQRAKLRLVQARREQPGESPQAS